MAWFNRGAHPEEQLSAYVDGELAARARAAVQSHLTACEACSALVDELRETKSLLAALPRQESPRSFALGPQYAVARRAPPPSRFGFAPVAALTVLLALLFVDAADFSSMSSSDDSSAGGASTAARQSESAEKDDGGAAASDGFQSPMAAAAESSPASGTGTAPNAAGASGTPAPPAQDRAAPAPEESPLATLTLPDQDEDESDGISTLRILEIVAALVLVGSLGVIYLPRIVNR